MHTPREQGFQAFIDGCNYEAGKSPEWREGWDRANELVTKYELYELKNHEPELQYNRDKLNDFNKRRRGEKSYSHH